MGDNYPDNRNYLRWFVVLECKILFKYRGVYRILPRVGSELDSVFWRGGVPEAVVGDLRNFSSEIGVTKMRFPAL